MLLSCHLTSNMLTFRIMWLRDDFICIKKTKSFSLCDLSLSLSLSHARNRGKYLYGVRQISLLVGRFPSFHFL